MPQYFRLFMAVFMSVGALASWIGYFTNRN